MGTGRATTQNPVSGSSSVRATFSRFGTFLADAI
jgi:hypothetical protein